MNRWIRVLDIATVKLNQTLKYVWGDRKYNLVGQIVERRDLGCQCVLMVRTKLVNGFPRRSMYQLSSSDIKKGRMFVLMPRTKLYS